MNAQMLHDALENGKLDDSLTRLYGKEMLDYARTRCGALLDRYVERFGDREGVTFFSSPGRVEITGNHTDHNHGLALAGAINLDILAVAAPASDNVIRIKSKGHSQDNVDLSDFTPRTEEATHSASLIRGIAYDLNRRGYKTGGFTACTVSDVPKGSGLSSSAAFEVLTGCILNHFYNNAQIPPETIAVSAQYAENVYFGKPSGLLDQMACSVGSIVRLDFEKPDAPQVKPIHLSLEAFGHRLVVVSAGHGHADLTDAYASIPAEMKTVAALFGREVLRGLDYETLLAHASEIRKKCGDRALLRAIHFVTENERVTLAAAAIERGDFAQFLAQVNASGNSSALCLQNIYPENAPDQQGVTLALAAAKAVLGAEGACRVHGGGFGGTMLAIVPEEKLAPFTARMEQLFGADCCRTLIFRKGADVIA